MPDGDDTVAVRGFVSHTVATYHGVIDSAPALRVAEREALRAALVEFTHEGHPDRIVGQYQELTEEQFRDIGLYGEQLRQKRQLARLAADDLRLTQVDPSGRLSVRRIQRWISRAKVLVGSLKGLVPAAEALDELLDLLDRALDRA